MFRIVLSLEWQLFNTFQFPVPFLILKSLLSASIFFKKKLFTKYISMGQIDTWKLIPELTINFASYNIPWTLKFWSTYPNIDHTAYDMSPRFSLILIILMIESLDEWSI